MRREAARLVPASGTIKSSEKSMFQNVVVVVFFCESLKFMHHFGGGRQVTKRHSDEACLAENAASAKWRSAAASLESKGQPEDRWQANHVENESCGKCTGHGWRLLRGVHLALTGPGLTWTKTSSTILHYVCQLAPSPRDSTHNSIFCPTLDENKHTTSRTPPPHTHTPQPFSRFYMRHSCLQTRAERKDDCCFTGTSWSRYFWPTVHLFIMENKSTCQSKGHRLSYQQRCFICTKQLIAAPN